VVVPPARNGRVYLRAAAVVECQRHTLRVTLCARDPPRIRGNALAADSRKAPGWRSAHNRGCTAWTVQRASRFDAEPVHFLVHKRTVFWCRSVGRAIAREKCTRPASCVLSLGGDRETKEGLGVTNRGSAQLFARVSDTDYELICGARDASGLRKQDWMLVALLRESARTYEAAGDKRLARTTQSRADELEKAFSVIAESKGG